MGVLGPLFGESSGPPATPPAPLPVGQVIESVVCRHDPTQSYALYLPSNGLLQIYEAGTQRVANAGSYNVGDRLRIVRTGPVIAYYRNGSLIYTSTVPSSGTLHAMGAINEVGASLGPCYVRNSGAANETALRLTSGNANGQITLSAYNTAGNVSTWNYTVKT